MTSPKPFDIPVGLQQLKALDTKFTSQIAGLRTNFGELGHQLKRQVERVDAIENLRLAERIVEMSGILDGLVRRDKAEVPVWNWSAMSAEEEGAAWSLLVAWLRNVLYVRWPADYSKALKPCWFQHHDVVELLSGLYLSWRWAYEDEDGTPTRVSEWLDRWRPSLVGRIDSEACSMHNCTQDNHRDPWQYVDHPTKYDAELSAYLSTRLQQLQQRDAQRAAAAQQTA
ncbi:hypothetical protein ACIGZJ_36175 [Kitasatospora sp. NPDC052868]|uniref:hypothetical protein n=1 Tax=Kitasatospora sp. NPDC052868 TaxID=3364060 RepID=UPI0037C884FF